MNLKIGLDARELENFPNSIGRILFNLLKSWGPENTSHQFYLYFKENVPDLNCIRIENFHHRLLKVPFLLNRHRIWEQFYLPGQLKRDGIDVFFSPNYTIPLSAPCSTVVLIHDISYQSYPEWYGFQEGAVLRWLTRKSIIKADYILCCSEFTKREIVRYYGAQWENKIQTVYWAAEKTFHPVQKSVKTSNESITPYQPYFLFVGTFFKRRNIPLLLQAFKRTSLKYPEYKLLLIGNTPRIADSWEHFANEPQIRNRVIHLPFIEETQLPVYYQNAFALIHPSSYEGFGMPIVEAMACGIPVIVSEAEAMVEIAQGAARIATPFSAETLSEAMSEMIKNPELRQVFIDRGLKRAQELSWGKTAGIILQTLTGNARRQN